MDAYSFLPENPHGELGRYFPTDKLQGFLRRES